MSRTDRPHQLINPYACAEQQSGSAALPESARATGRAFLVGALGLGAMASVTGTGSAKTIADPVYQEFADRVFGEQGSEPRFDLMNPGESFTYDCFTVSAGGSMVPRDEPTTIVPGGLPQNPELQDGAACDDVDGITAYPSWERPPGLEDNGEDNGGVDTEHQGRTDPDGHRTGEDPDPVLTPADARDSDDPSPAPGPDYDENDVSNPEAGKEIPGPVGGDGFRGRFAGVDVPDDRDEAIAFYERVDLGEAELLGIYRDGGKWFPLVTYENLPFVEGVAPAERPADVHDDGDGNPRNPIREELGEILLPADHPVFEQRRRDSSGDHDDAMTGESLPDLDLPVVPEGEGDAEREDDGDAERQDDGDAERQDELIENAEMSRADSGFTSAVDASLVGATGGEIIPADSDESSERETGAEPGFVRDATDPITDGGGDRMILLDGRDRDESLVPTDQDLPLAPGDGTGDSGDDSGESRISLDPVGTTVTPEETPDPAEE